MIKTKKKSLLDYLISVQICRSFLETIFSMTMSVVLFTKWPLVLQFRRRLFPAGRSRSRGLYCWFIVTQMGPINVHCCSPETFKYHAHSKINMIMSMGLDYHFNKNAWMTCALFLSWLLKFYGYIRKTKIGE